MLPIIVMLCYVETTSLFTWKVHEPCPVHFSLCDVVRCQWHQSKDQIGIDLNHSILQRCFSRTMEGKPGEPFSGKIISTAYVIHILSIYYPYTIHILYPYVIHMLSMLLRSFAHETSFHSVRNRRKNSFQRAASLPSLKSWDLTALGTWQCPICIIAWRRARPKITMDDHGTDRKFANVCELEHGT